MFEEDDDCPNNTGEYKVGYKRPPIETRFKAGQPSANPRGRISARDCNVAELLLKPSKIKINGKARSLGFAQITLEVTKAAALKGDKRAIKEIIILLTKHGVFRCPEMLDRGESGYFIFENAPELTAQYSAKKG